MRGKLMFFITGFTLLMFIAGFLIVPVSPSPKTYDLKVMKIGNVWKVVDATDTNKTQVKVKKKDTIIWTIEGTDAYFQFSNNIFNAVEKSDSLVDGYTKYVRDGKKLKLKIKDDAPSGVEVYAVFCTSDQVFARGDSPPKIVIE